MTAATRTLKNITLKAQTCLLFTYAHTDYVGIQMSGGQEE